MTQSKREPFAAIPHRFNGWITVGPCSFLTMMSGDDLRGAVDSINAAFNARVDEEIELVRLKTIRMCADKADRMGSEEIRNAILFETLPTELEGK